VVAGVKVIKFVLAAEFQVTPQVVVMLPTKLTVVSSAVGQGNVVLFKQLRFCLKSVDGVCQLVEKHLASGHGAERL
jgi:hypothetical protein